MPPFFRKGGGGFEMVTITKGLDPWPLGLFRREQSYAREQSKLGLTDFIKFIC